jgi:hypothetical protein
MILTYKYITITDDNGGDARTVYAGKPVYWIINKRSQECLGRIVWHAQWRRFVAAFFEAAVWSTDCLDCVQNAIQTITNKENTA